MKMRNNYENKGCKESNVEEQYTPDHTILTLSFVKKAAIKNGEKQVLSFHKIPIYPPQSLNQAAYTAPQNNTA